MIGCSARWLLAGAAVGLACCGTPTSGTDESPGHTTEASRTTETANVVPADEVETTLAGGAAVRASENGLVYLTMGGEELTMDVRVPPATFGSNRPVVVLFHGLSSAANDAADVTVVADAAAAAGMVVFAPEWIAGDPFPLLRDDITMLRRAGECALAFAQQEAPSFGGDPALVVTSGFSAGTGPALTAAISSAPDIDGCEATSPSDDVVGMVLGDGEYFWQSEPFDGAFAADPAGMLGEATLLIDPTGWSSDPDLRIRLWAAADGTAPRALDAALDGDDWLAARDADGTIRSELREFGALDDGSVDYVDNAVLFDRRAAAAGFDVELEMYSGGHTTDDKALEIVDLLLAVSGTS